MRHVIAVQVCALIEWFNAAFQAYAHNRFTMFAALAVALIATVIAMIVAQQRMHLEREKGYLEGLHYLNDHWPDLEITLKKKPTP